MLKVITNSETVRGVWASLMVSMAMVWVEVILDQAKVSPDATFLYNDILVGSTLSFLADKFFATASGFKMLQAGDFTGNIAQTLGAVSSTQFMRYFVTVFIDALVSVPLFVKVLKAHPTMKPLFRRIVKYAIALITFATFNNMLRFGWSYSDKVTDIADIVVAAFMICASMSYLNAPSVEPGSPGYAVMNEKSRLFFVMGGWSIFAMYQLTRMGVKIPKIPSSLILGGVAAVAGAGLVTGRKQDKSAPTPSVFDHVTGAVASVIVIMNVVWFLKYSKVKNK